MKIVQCSLKRKLTEDTFATLVVWLDYQKGLKEGCGVTLKDSLNPNEIWEVTHIGHMIMEKAEVVEKTRGAFFGRDKHRKNGTWENC